MKPTHPWRSRRQTIARSVALLVAVLFTSPGAAYAAKPDNPLAYRRPALPAADPAAGLTNPIDRLLAPYYQEHGVEPAKPVSDRVYARRVYLDLIGLLPPVDELEAFVADTSPNKRAALVARLLNDRRAYADHWLTFWNDALRNAYRGTGYIDGGRKQITGWLYRSLYENKPYNQFVRELIDPASAGASGRGAEGFTYGIKWRGVVNDSQRREMQAAQSIAQVLLGTNLKCASCHDSLTNQWDLTDAYGLASVFADKPLELHQCDKPMGEHVSAKFLFPQVGAIDAKAAKSVRLRQLADAMTSKQNGRVSRTIVNRLWAIFMGHGLVEPVDDMVAKPWSRDLLDWLAADLADHGYDLKRTMTLICTSRAYQRPTVDAPDPQAKSFTFRGPIVKRMSAEQFVDAVSTLTGRWQRVTPGMMKLDGRKQGGQAGAVIAVLAADAAKASGGGGGPGASGGAKKPAKQGAKKAPRAAAKAAKPAKAPRPAPVGQWIWSHAGAAKSDPGGRIFLRRTFRLDKVPARAVVAATCDNELALYVNGRRVGQSANWTKPVVVDVTSGLVRGDNVIAVEAINWPDKETGKGLSVGGANPGGFALSAAGFDGDRVVWSLVSDDQWRWRRGLAQGWQAIAFKDADWQRAAVIAPPGGGPWRLAVSAPGSVPPVASASKPGSTGAPQPLTRVRAAIADNDELMRALGRPSREQVVTRRDSLATTLQALEMTNGQTLDTLLRQGADAWLTRAAGSTGDLTTKLYLAALGRPPTQTERSAAAALVGSPATRDGVADLMWVVVMLPEFQLIY